jgi:diadenylate cyclase
LDSVGGRDLVEISILTMLIYALLRFLGNSRGPGMVRGFGLVVVGLVLGAQVIVRAFDLIELGKILDYFLTTVLVGLLVIFQPELRRGLMLLGRYPLLNLFRRDTLPMADTLAEAAQALSRECIGALIAVQRQVALAACIESGQRIDAELSARLIQTIFTPRSPLHDGALIIADGRITAAACQLPLGQPPEGTFGAMGMRHRAAICLSDETDAVLLIVSEETGRVSIAVAGKLEPVARENLSRRLAALLSSPVIARSEGLKAA